MTRKIFSLTLGAAAMLALSACGETPGLEGSWTQPVPGMDLVQGVALEAGGKASSIGMATLKYETWSREGDDLILSGKSIGNGKTLSFTDTLAIERLTADSLVLRRGSYRIAYGRQP